MMFFVLKYVHLCFLMIFTSMFKVIINIHKYANQMIYKSYHIIKDMCLIFNLTPILVL